MTTFYTGAGDSGTTTDFVSARRESKGSQFFAALGTLDETVSMLGFCRASLLKSHFNSDAELVLGLQQNLFTIQAELAGSDKRLGDEKVRALEVQITELGRTLPEIRTFLIPGESELSALFDLARTVARRAERELVRLRDESLERGSPASVSLIRVRPPVLAYMNRLSSLLYVLARREAKKSGAKEQPPKYS